MSKTIHVVSLDCPSPPDYGGAMDIFYKIKALSEAGVQVVLHYFDYRTIRSTKDVKPYCKAIYAYRRKPAYRWLPLSCPYIVQSRINEELIGRLNKDEHPVLLEGLHCSGIVPYLKSPARIVLRMHNNEAAYYRELARAEKHYLKKSYYLLESRLLLNYQKNFDKDTKLACLSTTDKTRLEEEYGFRNTIFLPCFLPWQAVKSSEGKGSYCLYHGNLSVPENKEAVRWLIQNVFSQIEVPFVIAGKGISQEIILLAKKHSTIAVVNNPPEDEMSALIRDAHIHVLPSSNATGVKLKLLNALLNGRFCLTNKEGEMGSGIKSGLLVKTGAADWQATITALMQQPFTAASVAERREILSLYNNQANAQKLSALWLHCQ